MKNVKKQNLPSKICLVCRKPFVWRKKWEKVWDEVKYCSDKCRANKEKKERELQFAANFHNSTFFCSLLAN